MKDELHVENIGRRVKREDEDPNLAMFGQSERKNQNMDPRQAYLQEQRDIDMIDGLQQEPGEQQ